MYLVKYPDKVDPRSVGDNFIRAMPRHHISVSIEYTKNIVFIILIRFLSTRIDVEIGIIW